MDQLHLSPNPGPSATTTWGEVRPLLVDIIDLAVWFRREDLFRRFDPARKRKRSALSRNASSAQLRSIAMAALRVASSTNR